MWIRLKNIQVYAYHGVHAFEREHGGRFEIDVEVEADLAQAVLYDDINKTVDYARLQQEVIHFATTGKFKLIETLACAIADQTLAAHPIVLQAIVRVRKPGAPTGGVLDTVEVECTKFRIPTI